MAILLAIYAVVLAADWIAPYDYQKQHRSLPLAPPTPIHFVDTEGNWHLRPFVYRTLEKAGSPGEYVEDPSERFPLRFLVPSEPRQAGPLTARWRLFGVEEGAHVFVLGTDRFGRDQLSRLLYGGRISLGAGLVAGALAVALGLVVGMLAGYYGGLIGSLAMRVGELFTAFPWFYLLVAVRAFLPLDLAPGTALLTLIAVISLLGWVRPAQLVRGVVLSSRERDFVHAARGFGASDVYLLWRHVLPQTRAIALTHFALLVPRLVLAEVTLSFLGLGIAAPMPSWGNMLAVLQQHHILAAKWWMSLPAVALASVILSYHHVASVLQERQSASVTA